MKRLNKNIKTILADENLQDIAYTLGVDFYARIKSLKDLYAEKQQITTQYDIGDVIVTLQLKK